MTNMAGKLFVAVIAAIVLAMAFFFLWTAYVLPYEFGETGNRMFTLLVAVVCYMVWQTFLRKTSR